MDPEQPRTPGKRARSEASTRAKSLRRERNYQKHAGRAGRYRPLQLLSAPSADLRTVVASRLGSAPPSAAASSSSTAPTNPEPTSPLAAPGESAADLRTLAAANTQPLVALASVDPEEPATDTPPSPPAKRCVRERLGSGGVRDPSILQPPAAGQLARPGGPGGTGPVFERRARALRQAESIARHAVPTAHLVGLHAQAEYRAEFNRTPLPVPRYYQALDLRASSGGPQRGQDLDATVSAIVDELANRIAEHRRPSRPPPVFPRPVSPNPPAAPGAGPPAEDSEEAILQHPAVVRLLRLRDQEIARLRHALICTLGPDAAHPWILGDASSSRGPVFPASSAALPPPPPWGRGA